MVPPRRYTSGSTPTNYPSLQSLIDKIDAGVAGGSEPATTRPARWQFGIATAHGQRLPVRTRFCRNAEESLKTTTLALWTFHGLAIEDERLESVVALLAGEFVKRHRPHLR